MGSRFTHWIVSVSILDSATIEVKEVQMRISELASKTGVPVPTIKYYLREGLLPGGIRSSPTQARYDETHVERLRLIRALGAAGASIASTRQVLATLENPPADAAELLGAAHAAVIPDTTVAASDDDTAEATALAAKLGWEAACHDHRLINGLADALGTLRAAAFEVPPEVMSAYLDSATRMAQAEIAGVPTNSREASVRYVVLGAVLPESLILALRRIAEQVAATQRFV
jgi:DNA-binding transcriptional MerR regulator